VPVLIDLLAELPPVGRVRAEEFLKELAGEWAVAGPTGNDATSRRLRRDAWAAWWHGVEGPRLLEEFRSRTIPDAEGARLLELVAKLGDPSGEVRAEATAGLIAAGPRAAPLLRRAATGSDARHAALAQGCLKRIEGEAPAPLPAAAARLLALRRPEGTVETLLDYLPCAESDAEATQVTELLAGMGVVGGKADALLVRALDDKAPARRAAAATALCRGGAKEQVPAVRRLLRDADQEARLAAAQALANLGEKDALPVLIALLAELPLERAWEVENFLGRVAGEKTPAVSVSADPVVRAQCRDAWAAWWRDQGGTIDLARAVSGRRYLGYLLVAEGYDQVRRSGSVAELDAAGRQRWRIDNLQYPQCAEVLANGHVLVAEQGSNRLSERELSGKVVWEKIVPSAFFCQRLRNGNTFVAGRQQLLEFDRVGKEVFRHNRMGDNIIAACKLRDGQVAFVTYQGMYARLDSSGKEAKSFRLPFNPNVGASGGLVLPEDRVVISTSTLNKVTEYDATGRTVWEATVLNPGVPCLLPNGNILFPSQANSCVTELDRKGKFIGERKDLPMRPWFASKR
jgi:hypothetical protein